MEKAKLQEAVAKTINETTNALQTVFDELNQGQQKKLLKSETVKALLDRYSVQYTE